MLVSLREISSFQFEKAEELVDWLRGHQLISLSLEDVKLECKKVWKTSDWEDINFDSEVIGFILEELANGYFTLEWNEDGMFTVCIIDEKKPLCREGKIPKMGKEKVKFS
jgi:hypothetical protein